MFGLSARRGLRCWSLLALAKMLWPSTQVWSNDGTGKRVNLECQDPDQPELVLPGQYPPGTRIDFAAISPGTRASSRLMRISVACGCCAVIRSNGQRMMDGGIKSNPQLQKDEFPARGVVDKIRVIGFVSPCRALPQSDHPFAGCAPSIRRSWGSAGYLPHEHAVLNYPGLPASVEPSRGYRIGCSGRVWRIGICRNHPEE